MKEHITNINELLNQLQTKSPDPSCLVSKNASENTKKLFEYLKSIYGRHVLSGQQYLQPAELEDAVYYHITGRLPVPYTGQKTAAA